MGKHIWDEPVKTIEKDVKTVEKAVEKEYVHVPGTVHLNAYIADIEECKKKVTVAMSELKAAEERLLQKKQESGMI